MPVKDRVQEFITHLNKSSYKTRDEVLHPLSAEYVCDLVALLKRIIGKGVRDWELTLPEIPYKEQRYFTADEMSCIITAASGKWKPFFALLAETGLRCGEAFGLHVEDLDLKAQRLTVRRSIYRGIEGTPKTRKGYRTVDINPEPCQMLKQHLKGRASGYVFKTENSTPLSQQNSRRMLHTILDRLGISKAGLHAYRHRRVSILQAARMPGDLIKQWVGHSSLKTTSGYTHFEPKFARKEAERVGLFGLNSPHGPQNAATACTSAASQSVAA